MSPAPVWIRLWRFVSGYTFAVILLGFLLVLTFLGTIAQRHDSLYEVQKRYFESLFVFEEIGPLVIPLPGVALLLFLLSVNLVCGGIVRIRKRAATAGVIVAHLGILWMLVAGLVEYQFSTKGHMTLKEGQSADEYVSFFEWEIALSRDGELREYVIPGERFIGLPTGEVATFVHAELPFSLSIDSVYKNSAVERASVTGSDDPAGARRFRLVERAPSKRAEADLAGCYVTVRGEGMAETRHILWAGQRLPLTIRTPEDGLWLVDLRRRRWLVPFTIELLDFRKEDHPGTSMARSYESDVRLIEGAFEETITISMNNPLRHRGYTLFQSSWDIDRRDGRPFSQFSVVKNPADKWPELACYVIGLGLLLHFARKLFLYVRRTAGSRA